MRHSEATFDLLMRCCADTAQRGAAAPLTEPEAPQQDWDAFLHLVERHRVAGLVHRRLAQNHAFPEAVRRRIAAEAAIIARRNAGLAAETVRLQRRLDAAGLAPVFLKGFTLSQRAYGAGGVKHSKDIDFLVDEADARRCIILLESDGYSLILPRRALTPAQWEPLLRYSFEVEMMHPRTRVQIEPHWRLTENPDLLDARSLVTAAGTGWHTIGGVPIRTLCPADEFAYLCVHGARGLWFRLKWIVDVYALVSHASHDEMDSLYLHAAERRVGPCVDLAFALCATLFGLQLSASARARVQSDWRLKALHRLSMTSLRSSQFNLWTAFATSLLLARLHGYLRSELARWTVSINDRMDLPLPARLHFLYLGIRLPRWIARRMKALVVRRKQESAEGLRSRGDW